MMQLLQLPLFHLFGEFSLFLNFMHATFSGLLALFGLAQLLCDNFHPLWLNFGADSDMWAMF